MEATTERKEGADYPESMDSLKAIRESSARPRLLADSPLLTILARGYF
jgi:hypothetical protein